MAQQRLRIRNFSGGLSDDDKYGPNNSFGKAVSLNFRSYIGKMSLKRQPAQENDITLDDYPHDAARVADGTVYFAAGSRVYKRASGSNGAAGTYTKIAAFDGAGAYDCDYNKPLDALFFYGDTAIHQYSPINNSTQLIKFADIAYLTQANTGSTYTLPTSISEAAANTISFTAGNDGLNLTTFQVNTKGTGNWTLTLHDGANRVIDSVTILNASIPTSGAVTFTYHLSDAAGNYVRTQLGHDYHIHLTVSAGTSKIVSSVSNDLSTANIVAKAQRLIANNKYFHRTIQFGAKTYFCNEHYLGEWELLDLTANSTSGFNAYRLAFPSNYVSCGVAIYSEYLAVACAIDNSTDSLNNNATDGMILFWDGTSSTFNFSLPVPQGVPETLFAADNGLYWIARGVLYFWAGGDITPIYRFPGVNEFLQGGADAPAIDTYLSAPRIGMANRGGLLHVGFPAQSANANIEPGIYTYGSMKRSTPKAISKDYLLSTGTTGINFLTSSSPDTPVTGLTLVKDFGTNFLVGWRDMVSGTLTNGVDYVNDVSALVAAASWRSLWFDNGDPDIAKTPTAIKVTFRTLQSNCLVIPTIEYDRSGIEKTGTGSDGIIIRGNGGDIDVVLPLDSNDDFYEARFGINLSSGSRKDIEIISLTFKFDDNHENELATEEHRHVS